MAEVRSPGRFFVQLAEEQEGLKAMMDRSGGLHESPSFQLSDLTSWRLIPFFMLLLMPDLQAGQGDGDFSGGAGGGAQGEDHLISSSPDHLAA